MQAHLRLREVRECSSAHEHGGSVHTALRATISVSSTVHAVSDVQICTAHKVSTAHVSTCQ